MDFTPHELNEISVLKRKQIPFAFLEKGNEDEQLSKANEMLGYPNSMSDEQFENANINWVFELKWTIKNG